MPKVCVVIDNGNVVFGEATVVRKELVAEPMVLFVILPKYGG